MRLSSAFGLVSTGIAMFLALYACGGESGGSSGTTPLPDGAVVDEDGAIIEPGADGPVIPPDTAKPSKVDVTNEQVSVLGGPRSYTLSVPKKYDAARQYPLIIALHGDGQSGDGFRLFLGLDDISGDDAITAYPDQVVDLFAPYDQNQDQQLVEAVINDVKGKRSIDAAKVWAFGYSKGGYIANELACRKPGMFKAMAAHAAGAPQVPAAQCPGIVGLPVMLTEGDKDTAVGASFGASYWATINGCSTSRAPTTPAGCEKYTGCEAGKPVTYCLAAGVSHYPIWTGAAQASWDFFKSL
jgi:polyhydroxybutyrate depolymerase